MEKMFTVRVVADLAQTSPGCTSAGAPRIRTVRETTGGQASRAQCTEA